MRQFFLTITTLIFLSSCSSDHTLYGYIEGENTYISSSISGTLFNLAVDRGQTIHKGDLLFELDPQPEKDAVEQSKATLAQLDAELVFDKTQLERQKKLYEKNATAKENLDEAQKNYDSKLEQIQATHAQLKQLEWALSQKTVYAPIEGKVFDRFFLNGEKVPANQPVLALLSPSNIHVLFYIPEKERSKIHIGQAITFSCDSCKNKTKAEINYISPDAEYTPPVIYSKDTRNKLVYLVRAKIPENSAIQFNPGQPIDVHLTWN